MLRALSRATPKPKEPLVARDASRRLVVAIAEGGLTGTGAGQAQGLSFSRTEPADARSVEERRKDATNADAA